MQCPFDCFYVHLVFSFEIRIFSNMIAEYRGDYEYVLNIFLLHKYTMCLLLSIFQGNKNYCVPSRYVNSPLKCQEFNDQKSSKSCYPLLGILFHSGVNSVNTALKHITESNNSSQKKLTYC